jgi:hypothetical protein
MPSGENSDALARLSTTSVPQGWAKKQTELKKCQEMGTLF